MVNSRTLRSSCESLANLPDEGALICPQIMPRPHSPMSGPKNSNPRTTQPRTVRSPMLHPRKPHPTSRIKSRCSKLLRPRKHRICQDEETLRSCSHPQPSDRFPLVRLVTQIEMLRLLIYKTAWHMDRTEKSRIEEVLTDRISMCNYWANALCCEAADRAIQVHGAIGYSRHKPFEHIYRHHRRYRITEGSEEIQMRRVGAKLAGLTHSGRKSESKTKL